MTHVSLSDAEYERRLDAVESSFDVFGVDAVCVTSVLPVRYLTGTDSYGTFVAPLVIGRGAPPVYVVRRYDEARVRVQSRIAEVRSFFGEGDMVEVWADTLRSLGLDEARLGLELDLWGLAPADVDRLRTMLPRLRIVDTSKLVLSVMDVKSPEEVAAMRRAMELTVTGIQAFSEGLVEGAVERSVASACEAAMIGAGSEVLEPFELLFGDRTALPHGVPGEGRLRVGDVAFTELSGTWLGYCAGLARTGILGRNPGAESLYGVAREALEAAIAAIEPGVTTGTVDAACRMVTDRAGVDKPFRTGYSIGLGWMSRGSMSLGPGGTDVIVPGMTFHIPVNLFGDGLGVGCSETVLVTEDGAEGLSGLSMDLLLV